MTMNEVDVHHKTKLHRENRRKILEFFERHPNETIQQCAKVTGINALVCGRHLKDHRKSHEIGS